MTEKQADLYLKDLELINPGSDMQRLWTFGVSLIGEKGMQNLKEWVTEKEGGEEYLLNKCSEDPYFRIIHSQKYDLFRQELIWLDSILPPNALVADLGCNTGHLTTVMARMRPSSRFIGYDCLEKPIEKAMRWIKKFKCEMLTFEQRDVFNLQINPKPDGLISLQGVGLALSSKRLADAVCNIADTSAFFAVVERFDELDEFKAVYENLEQNGFVCVHQKLLKTDCIFKKGAMPGFVFTRGLPGERIPFDKVSFN